MSKENPIFILACSPRSGSTWLQRIVTSTGDALIWGESTVMGFPGGDLWSRRDGEDFRNPNDLTKFQEKKAGMWMAVLNPFEDVFNKSFKHFFEECFEESAHDEGFKRWGKKETSWSDKSVDFILDSWPRAKIIFLTRRFEASYKSRFPARDNSTWTAQNFCREADLDEFCRNWCDQISFALSLKNISNCKLIKYENLFNQATMRMKTGNIRKLLDWLEVGEADFTQSSPLISCTDPSKMKKRYDICEVDWKTVVSKYSMTIKSLSSQLKYNNPFNQKEKK